MKKTEYCRPETVCFEMMAEQVFAVSTQELEDFEIINETWES